MKKYILLFGVLSILLSSCADNNKLDINKVESKVSSVLGDNNIKIESIDRINKTDIYQVNLQNNQVFYVYKDLSLLISGPIFDLNKKSIVGSDDAKNDKVNFNDLPFQNTIKEVRGNGNLKLVVFSDPDCPFCKKLEQELKQIDNITIYTFLTPLVGLHPDAKNKSIQIWCNNDKLKSWNNFMRRGEEIPSVKECKNPIDENIKTFEELGFDGTPILVFPNGTVEKGLIPKKELLELLNKNQ